MTSPAHRHEPRKILFLVRSLGVGGAERQVTMLARGLQGRGHQVTVACFYGGGGLETELHACGVRVVQLEKRHRWDVVGFSRRLLGVLREIRPDVVHSYLLIPNILNALVSRRVAGATVVWGVRASDVTLTTERQLDRLAFRFSRALSHFADLIVANSWAGAESHARLGYPRRIVHVVPNGIDTERFQRDAEGGCRLREQWGIPPGATLVGIVARLDPIKGHELFLHALAELVPAHPGIRAVCVGSGLDAYAAHLRRLAARLGLEPVVTWAGRRLDVRTVYSALDVVCSASTSEGFPNVVGEAMACGVPCVATDVGDSARIIGKLGVVVPAGEPKPLAAGIARLLRERSPALAAACRARICEHFGLARLIDLTEELLCRAS